MQQVCSGHFERGGARASSSWLLGEVTSDRLFTRQGKGLLQGGGAVLCRLANLHSGTHRCPPLVSSHPKADALHT